MWFVAKKVILLKTTAPLLRQLIIKNDYIIIVFNLILIPMCFAVKAVLLGLIYF